MVNLKGKILYGLVLTLVMVSLSGATVLATSSVSSGDVSPHYVSTSGNNTFADVSSALDALFGDNSLLEYTTVSSNNLLTDIADTVSSNNTTSAMMSADLADINSNLALLVSANAPTFYAYQLTDYYKNYFTGLLQNMPRTNYLAFALPKTHYNGSYNYNVTHYYLVYNIMRDSPSGEPLLGSYPAYDCYTDNGNYHQDNITYSLSSLPSSGYGSFRDYSALIDYSLDWRGLTVIVVGALFLFIFLRRR